MADVDPSEMGAAEENDCLSLAWIGNSFIYFNDLPTIVKNLLQEKSGGKDKLKELKIHQAQVCPFHFLHI